MKFRTSAISEHATEEEAAREAERLWDQGRRVMHIRTRDYQPSQRTIMPWLVIEKRALTGDTEEAT